MIEGTTAKGRAVAGAALLFLTAGCARNEAAGRSGPDAGAAASEAFLNPGGPPDAGLTFAPTPAAPLLFDPASPRTRGPDGAPKATDLP